MGYLVRHQDKRQSGGRRCHKPDTPGTPRSEAHKIAAKAAMANKKTKLMYRKQMAVFSVGKMIIHQWTHSFFCSDKAIYLLFVVYHIYKYIIQYIIQYTRLCPSSLAKLVFKSKKYGFCWWDIYSWWDHNLSITGGAPPCNWWSLRCSFLSHFTNLFVSEFKT